MLVFAIAVAVVLLASLAVRTFLERADATKRGELGWRYGSWRPEQQARGRGVRR